MEICYEDFSELDKKDQLALFKTMKQDLFPKSSNKLDRLLTNNRKSRFLSGLCRLHCQSTAVKRNEEILLKFLYKFIRKFCEY